MSTILIVIRTKPAWIRLVAGVWDRAAHSGPDRAVGHDRCLDGGYSARVQARQGTGDGPCPNHPDIGVAAAGGVGAPSSPLGTSVAATTVLVRFFVPCAVGGQDTRRNERIALFYASGVLGIAVEETLFGKVDCRGVGRLAGRCLGRADGIGRRATRYQDPGFHSPGGRKAPAGQAFIWIRTSIRRPLHFNGRNIARAILFAPIKSRGEGSRWRPFRLQVRQIQLRGLETKIGCGREAIERSVAYNGDESLGRLSGLTALARGAIRRREPHATETHHQAYPDNDTPAQERHRFAILFHITNRMKSISLNLKHSPYLPFLCLYCNLVCMSRDIWAMRKSRPSQGKNAKRTVHPCGERSVGNPSMFLDGGQRRPGSRSRRASAKSVTFSRRLEKPISPTRQIFPFRGPNPPAMSML